MARGWIKLHRSIQDNVLWSEKPFDKARAWIDLLLLADHEDNGKFEKGKVYRSTYWLAERWGWSRSKVRNYLSLLSDLQMILIKSLPKGLVITIVKWDFFQGAQPNKKPNKKPNKCTDDLPHTRIKEEKEEEPVVLPSATDLIHGGYR